MHWMTYAGVAIALWGVNGLFMKLGTNCVSARSMVIWVTAGFLIFLPFVWGFTSLSGLSAMVITVGLLGGFVNGLGNWAVFASLGARRKGKRRDPLDRALSAIHRDAGNRISQGTADISAVARYRAGRSGGRDVVLRAGEQCPPRNRSRFLAASNGRHYRGR